MFSCCNKLSVLIESVHGMDSFKKTSDAQQTNMTDILKNAKQKKLLKTNSEISFNKATADKKKKPCK